MSSSRIMQGTTSHVYRALALAIILFNGDTEAQSTITSTSTTTAAATTVTITLLHATSSLAQSTDNTFSTNTYALAAVLDSTTSSISSIVTATSTIAHTTTTISMSSNSLSSVVLNSTNYYRSHHQANPVRWNDTLADYAKDYAEGCIWKHSGGPYGENLAANFENSTLAIDAWAHEEKKYDYSKRKFSTSTGHFTQLVWKNTTDVGCAVIDCNNNANGGVQGAYLVCEYSPAGNVQGQFKWNVGKPGITKDGTLGFGSAAARSSGTCRGSLVLALITTWLLLVIIV